MQVESFRAMNSDIVLAAEGEAIRVQSGFIAARNFIEAAEKRFTRFSDDSELMQLNRSAGTWFQASRDLFELLTEALFYFHKTHGLFDLSILPDLRNAGYIQSMDEIRRFGADPQPARHQPASHPTFASVELKATDSTIRLPADMQIDLGGIAKGWIAERAAQLLSQFTSACAVNAGGDIFMIGYPDGQDYWEVGLEDPLEPQLDVMLMLLQPGAVATSSTVKRAWKQGDLNRHHLIDPRTGEPANTNWLSVTVLAPHAATAETFAKAFLMANEAEVKTLGEQNPELTVLAVNEAGKLVQLVIPREGLNVAH